VQTEKNIYSNCISFSFQFLDVNHHKFNVNGKQANYFQKLIDRLKDISSIERRQLSGYSNKTLRFHSIKWVDTTERCFGIPNEDTIVEEPMQFSLSANEHGRVHGFFIENVFHIVWLDPNHELY
jgi:hypothetical protein